MTEDSLGRAAEKISFDAALDRVSKEIKSRLLGTPTVIRRLTVHLSRSAGKLVRARAVLVSAMSGGVLIPADAVFAAAAVELLHLGTLVHDDILDDAERRRGIASLHRRFGVKPAVLCGDYLFCLALELAGELTPREDRRGLLSGTLPNYMSDVLLGELRQDQNTGNYKLTESRYFEIIGGKTAALFEAACVAGFLLSDEPDGALETYREIGRSIGFIFQLADDCADYELTSKTSNKPVLSDLRSGVVTLPLIYALKEDKGLLERMKTGARPAALKKAVTASGGLTYTRQKITGISEKTAALIATLPSAPEKKAFLLELLDGAAGPQPQPPS